MGVGVKSHLVCDPTIRQPGFDLPRQEWSLLNHFRTEQGHCGACRRKWQFTDTDLCPRRETRRCPTLWILSSDRQSMLATSISPTSTTLMTQSFLLMIQQNGTMIFEILRHQQALWVSTQTGIKRRSKILELELLQEQSILTIKQ